MASLILCLPAAHSAATPEYDYVLTRDGQLVDSHGCTTAGLLPVNPARGAETVAVVPVAALSWHLVKFPKPVAEGLLATRTDPARVRAVLAGAMEEQLLDEPERVHFALFAAHTAPVTDVRLLWVAVCDRTWLQTSLAALEAAGHPVTRIVAEHEPLQAQEPAQAYVSANLTPAQVVLVSRGGVSTLPLCEAAVALVRQSVEGGAQPDIAAEPGVLALAERAFNVPVTPQTRPQRLLLAAQSGWNLAQLDCSASRADRVGKSLAVAWQALLHAPRWRPLRWGLVALLVVQVVALNALAWREQSQLEAKRVAVRSVLSQTFPQVTVIVDAPVQMQREVAALARSRGAITGGGLAPVMAEFSAMDPAKTTLKAIDLVANEVRLTVTGGDAESLQQLTSGLAQRGWVASRSGDQITVQAQEAR
jgi:general secretion pathway protein L